MKENQTLFMLFNPLPRHYQPLGEGEYGLACCNEGQDIFWDCFRIHNSSCVAGLGMIAERRERSVIGYSIFLMGNKNIEGVGMVEQGSSYISSGQYCQTMVLRLCSLFMSLHSQIAYNEG